MKLDELVTWYQKKIGTYDKQQWEKTVEQRILDGFSGFTLKTAKLKTDLIDVDLVRGSTFPKAKPKQSLLTVIRLAILRYIFLPVYAKWWVRQTSPNVFGLLLLLYMAQMFNWAVYTYNTQRLDADGGGLKNATATSSPPLGQLATAEEASEEHIVSLSELLIPMVLSLLLSLIHSQIVATNTLTGAKPKRRRFSNASQGSRGRTNGSLVGPQDSRVRRRKKLIKVRSQDLNTEAVAQTQRPRPTKSTLKKSHSSVETLAGDPKISSVDMEPAASPAETTSLPNTSQPTKPNKAAGPTVKQQASSTNLRLDLGSVADCPAEPDPANSAGGLNKKRNVNWHSPIDNFAITSASSINATSLLTPTTTSMSADKQQQTSPRIGLSPNSSSTSSTTSAAASGNNSPNQSSTTTTTTGGEHSPNGRIDVCVQEFYEDLISRTADELADEEEEEKEPREPRRPHQRRNVGEDDGFESLNGKSSSGEETVTVAVAPAPTLPNQLRRRLNVAEGQKTDETEETKLSNGFRRKVPLSSESDLEKSRQPSAPIDATYQQKIKLRSTSGAASTDETEDEREDEDAENISSPNSVGNNSNFTECTTSATEWLGVTTNSDECSYSSDLEHSDSYKGHYNVASDEENYDLDFTPTTILNPHGTSDRISCTIWDQREVKKAQMSVLEISSCIIDRVESMPETNDYIYFGIGFSVLLSLIPSICRLCEVTIDADSTTDINYFDVPMLLWEKASFSVFTIFRFAFGHSQWERTVLVISFMQRLCLTFILFIIFSVAERTFKQRFLYAKLFSHLTSSRRAKKSNLPHFRLNKVRNIKTWLSVRSYLKKRGPQRSVDIIVSAAFIVTLLLLAFLSVEWLKDSVHLHSHLNLEALLWSTTIGIFLLRFMTLGNKIHHKYRSVSVLITEQINLYLQIEQKPKKKDELMVSNSVLKLASDLLKELETPFKISGLSANPYLFTTIKVVILSALSGVLSEMLGFKLKLHKIKIK